MLKLKLLETRQALEARQGLNFIKVKGEELELWPMLDFRNVCNGIALYT